MDKIQKALKKLSNREREIVKATLLKLQNNSFISLDIQKLQGNKNTFRVRKGDIRIIYQQIGSDIFVLAIERRSEKTYRNF